MKTFRRYCFFACSILITFVFSCKDSPVVEETPQFSILNSYSITVHAYQYDTLYNVVPFVGPAFVTLTFPGLNIVDTIQRDDSTRIFVNAPSKSFILSAQKDGFYPVKSIIDYPIKYISVWFYPLGSHHIESDSLSNTTVTVSINLYDTFRRSIPCDRAFEVTLTSQHQTLHSSIAPKDSICVFKNLVYEQYMANVEADGCFPSHNYYQFDHSTTNVDVPIVMQLLPNPTTKLDSISAKINFVTPQLYFKFYPREPLPSDGQRSVVLFAGLTPGVSSTFGTYVYSSKTISQAAGSISIETKNLYNEMLQAGIHSGVNVYVTGRILSGATIEVIDEQTKLPIYRNLENNTTAIFSFTMP